MISDEDLLEYWKNHKDLREWSDGMLYNVRDKVKEFCDKHAPFPYSIGSRAVDNGIKWYFQIDHEIKRRQENK
jgi:hypothetical protein